MGKKQRRMGIRNRKQKAAQTRRRLGWAALIAFAATAGFLVLRGGLQSQGPVNRAETDLSELPVAPEVGAVAPDFELQDLGGQQISLSDFRGKPVVVAFFHTW